jgi:hypothetical protein
MVNARSTVYYFQMAIVATLEIYVLEADGLPRPPSGHQRPSCVVEVAGRDAVRTRAVKKSDMQVWKETFSFADLELDGPVLRFTLRVVERKREIGCADVEQPLDGTAGQRIDGWADLSEGGRVHFGVVVVEIEGPPAQEPDAPEEPADEASQEQEQQEPQDGQGPQVGDDRQAGEATGRRRQPWDGMTPRAVQLRTKLQNDNKKPQEIEERACAVATRKYWEFLKKRTPRLLENAAMAKQYRESQAEEGDAAAYQTPK